ncbi:putative coiled coil protein [Candidatus Ichthyocystis hellenicum]|uniref:Putative coiled coil protein n=1 Tax=Candidatus Ichthyocystis hellenicum TaxID=1561003 RepID=A0A0S4M202_9BURK|nr:hypothetical protein [Candidatus Ichthyocystis hellenicum]CUT17710.1 putative coiled coil protein [Candidatus Ichthyocystis hellenicum]
MAFGNDRQISDYQYCVSDYEFKLNDEISCSVSGSGTSTFNSDLVQNSSPGTGTDAASNGTDAASNGTISSVTVGAVASSSCSADLSRVTASSYLLYLAKILCYGYGFNICTKDMDGVLGDDFFKSYATVSGYQFSDDFLCVINEYKIKFVSAINKILHDGGIKFFEGQYNGDMPMACYNFSKAVYRIRPECISVLQSKFIPEIIDAIIKGTIIDSNGERAMVSAEMEQFFLYFVTTLERLIMLEIMGHWNKFYNTHQHILSLPDDFKDPFIYSSFYGNLSVPVVSHPAAFTHTMMECVSFFASFRIKEIINDFSSRYSDDLKIIVYDKVLRIPRGGSSSQASFKKFTELELPAVIKTKFDEMMSVDMNSIINYLKEFMMWPKLGTGDCVLEVDLSILLKKIMDSIFYLLSEYVSCFCRRLSKNYVTRGRSSCLKSTVIAYHIKEKLKLNIHPVFYYNVISVRNQFSCKIRSIVYRKFCQMIEGGFTGFYWFSISSFLLQVAKDETKETMEEEYVELLRIVSESFVLAPGGGMVKLTSDERRDVMRIIVSDCNEKFISLTKSLWVKATKSLRVKSVSSFGNCEGTEGCNVNDVVNYEFEKNLGFNLAPIFDYNIYLIKKRFFAKIKSIIYAKISDMIKSGFSRHHWVNVSDILLSVAREEVREIIEEQRRELEQLISEAVAMTREGTAVRLTRDECDNVMRIVMSDVDEKFVILIKSLWKRVVSSFGGYVSARSNVNIDGNH